MNVEMIDFIHEMKRHWNERKENPLRGALYLCFIADKVVLEHPEYKAFHKELRDAIFNPVFGPYNAIDQVVCRVLGLNVIEHDVEKHCNRLREAWLETSLELVKTGLPPLKWPTNREGWKQLWEHTK